MPASLNGRITDIQFVKPQANRHDFSGTGVYIGESSIFIQGNLPREQLARPQRLDREAVRSPPMFVCAVEEAGIRTSLLPSRVWSQNNVRHGPLGRDLPFSCAYVVLRIFEFLSDKMNASQSLNKDDKKGIFSPHIPLYTVHQVIILIGRGLVFRVQLLSG